MRDDLQQQTKTMNDSFCHTHNLVDDSLVNAERPWGIRVSAPATDPFNKLVGRGWQREHWYVSAHDRDAAYKQMSKRHGFYRIGDDPSQILEKIDPDNVS